MLTQLTRPARPATQPDYPRLKNSLRVETVAPDTVFVLLDNDHRVFTGPLFHRLIPLLDGTHTVADLMLRLDGVAFPHQVLRALGQLAHHGLLDDGQTDIPPAETAYWLAQGINAATARRRLAATRVRVVALGSADRDSVVRALAAADVRLADADAYDCTVVVTDEYLQPDLKAINRAALDEGKPWLLLKPTGRIAWIGPVFEPGTTACWSCMAQRVSGNRQVETYIQRKNMLFHPLPTSRPALPTTLQTAVNMAVNEIVKWIALGDKAPLRDQLLTVDTASLQTQKHPVVKRPQCPECGDPTGHVSAELQPVTLSSAPKRFTADGGHRVMLPEETFARFKHHISPITGVVSSLVSRSELNGLTYSYTAGHNFALWGDDMAMLRKNMRSQSGGKGRTRVQAQVSGLCEAIERYSGVYRDQLPHTVRASYREMGDRAIHPYDVLLYSDYQYATRRAWNAALDAPFNTVTEPFDENLVIEWLPLTSLTHDRFRYMAAANCFYGHPDIHHFFCGSDSNGCAAGNTPEEAILQGFLELAERDAVAIWWYNRLRRPGVDVGSFNMPYFFELEAFYARHNRTLWVIDLTHDLGLPTFAAVSGRTDREIEDIVIGFGAHLDAKTAIMRALTEVNQFLPSVMMTKPDGTTRYLLDKGAVKWFETATMATERYLVPDENVPLRTAADFPALASADIRDDVMTCVRAAERIGLETFVLDQTLPDVGLNVFRVIVPGMRHFWRRMAPGRLYDVPVKLGWLSAPLDEHAMNPHSLFF